MKHLFIINPIAGGKKNRASEIEAEIHSLFAGNETDYDIYYTTAPMDACKKIREEAASGQELRVYACGGDGTLNECVNGAACLANVSVTVYPCGTGNDFIKMFGDSDAKLFASLDELVNGFVRPIDIIDCNGRFCANICSVGIDARVGADVHKYSRIPLIGGAGGYIVSLIVNLFRGINQKMRVSFEDSSSDSEYALICACNGRFYGGGFNPVPDAIPDDGLMEVLVVRAISLFQVPSLIGKYAKGRYKELTDFIEHRSVQYLELSAPEQFVVNVDGEAIYTDRITFHMIPKGVNFIFPRSMEFYRPLETLENRFVPAHV